MSTATLHTNRGPIEVELHEADAPKTVANFTKLAGEGFYDGVIFHRVIAGLHDPGRRSDRNRHAAAPATRSRTSSTSTRSSAARSRWRMPARTPTAASSSSSLPTPVVAGRQAHRLRPVTSGMDTVDEISTLPSDARDKPRDDAVIERVELAD